MLVIWLIGTGAKGFRACGLPLMEHDREARLF